MPLGEILGFGFFPSIVFIASLLFMLMKMIKNPGFAKRKKVMVWILIALILILAPGIALIILKGKYASTLRAIEFGIWAVFWAFFLCQIIKLYLLSLAQEKIVEHGLFHFMAIIFIGFLAYASSWGFFWGNIQSSFSNSFLPIVELKDSPKTSNRRLLFKRGNHLYLTMLLQKGHPKEISIVPLERVLSIHSHLVRINDNVE